MKNNQQAKLVYVGVLIGLLTSVGCFSFALAKEEAENAVSAAKEALRESVKILTGTKDSVSGNKDEKRLAASKDTIRKTIDLSFAEIQSFKKKLNEITIEELVTDDYEFDAAAVHERFVRALADFGSYYTDLATRLQQAKTEDEIRVLAKEFKSWREKTYNPTTQLLLDIDLALRQKAVVAMGSNRFDKILIDIRKLKNAKLITIAKLEPFLAAATADQKITASLDDGATQLVLQLISGKGDESFTEKHKRLGSLVEQSFAKTKDMYKKFGEINKIIKEMLAG